MAALSSPFTTDELKHCALTFKDKISSDQGGFTEFSADNNTVLFGPCLNLTIQSDDFSDNEKTVQKIINVFSPLVIGTCLLSAGESKPLILPPPLLFRAAAVANMYLRQNEYSLGNKWKIGKLIWLPNRTNRLAKL
jgi:hypothetical protein